MTEEREDEGLVDPELGDAPPPPPVDDEFGGDEDDPGDFGDGAPEGDIDASALLAEAEEDQMRARASWHLLPRAVFTFGFANCLFFAGAISAWSRMVPPDWLRAAGKPVQDLDPSMYLNGLDTIRGTFIFALALYGFLQIFFNVFGRTIKVWPFVVNALLALEVGISGIVQGKSSKAWEYAQAYLDSDGVDKTMADDMFLTWSAIPPAYWALTAGGVLVLIVSLASIMQGAQKAKAAAAEETETRRRRR